MVMITKAPRTHLRCHSGTSRNVMTTRTIPPVLTSFINGTPVPVQNDLGTDQVFINRSPVSGKPLCDVQIPTRKQVESTITSANHAFFHHESNSGWSAMPVSERGNILLEMSRILRENQKEMCYLEALDSGIPILQIEVNHVAYAIQSLEYYAALALQGGSAGKYIEVPLAGGHSDSFAYTRREPLGVCAAIGAWNYPLVTMIWKIAPALVCGNTVIYKPSECTPLSAWHVVTNLWKNVLPPGVLQVLLGEAETAKNLVAHPDIAKISLTGSKATGIEVARQGADTLKLLTLELGGKSPLLVFADADMDSAVRVAINGNFVNNGQVCTNCTRVYIERSVLDQFISSVIEQLQSMVVIGDNMSTKTNVGPLIMPPRHPSGHFDRVMGLINRAKQDCGDDVQLIYGGNGYQDGMGGYYVEPTIFVSKRDSVEIVQTEVFGPVMTILPFDTEEEAVERANTSTDFGLAAGAMTKDVMRAHRLAKRLAAGVVWINNWNLSPVEVPFGPFKSSGYGKELGVEALDCYSQIKTVYVEMGDIRSPTTLS